MPKPKPPGTPTSPGTVRDIIVAENPVDLELAVNQRVVEGWSFVPGSVQALPSYTAFFYACAVECVLEVDDGQTGPE